MLVLSICVLSSIGPLLDAARWCMSLAVASQQHLISDRSKTGMCGPFNKAEPSNSTRKNVAASGRADTPLQCCCKKERCKPNHEGDLWWHQYTKDHAGRTAFSCCKLTSGLKRDSCPWYGYTKRAEVLLPHIQVRAGYSGGACELPTCGNGEVKLGGQWGATCECAEGYQGSPRFHWFESTWSEFCLVVDCPDSSSGHPKCSCNIGHRGNIVWKRSTQEYEGTCQLVSCPRNSEGQSPDCICRHGYTGRLEWNVRTQDFDGTCTKTSCPEHSSGDPICKCDAGYSGLLSYDAHTMKYKGNCNKVECPDGAVGHPKCRCDAGFKYAQLRVRGKKHHKNMSWNATSDTYTGFCLLVKCTLHASGHPDCACDAGFRGQLEWNAGDSEYRGECAEVQCPPHASGHLDCTCDAGFRGQLEWSALDSEYRGVCVKVQCPLYSTAHPNCKCEVGYKGGIEWIANTQRFHGKCTMAWAVKVSTGTCIESEMTPILDANTCLNAARAFNPRTSFNFRQDCFMAVQGCTYKSFDNSFIFCFKESQKQFLQDAHICIPQDATAPRCEWNLFSGSGPKFTDLSQGKLGSCYLLAALASFAHTRPEVLEEMITEGTHPNDFKRKLYQVRWFINGVARTVAVDDAIPVDKTTGEPLFVTYNDGNNFWPVVLEKSYAKVFGNYNHIRGGSSFDAMAAITQAPLVKHSHASEEEAQRYNDQREQLWTSIADAAEKRFPIWASSYGSSNVVVGGHAFAVLGIGKVAEKDCVRLYNPWGHHRYKGNLTHVKTGDGSFWMPFVEYYNNFDLTAISAIDAGYTLSSYSLPPLPTSMKHFVRVKFKTRRNEPFFVQLIWPNKKYLTAGQSINQRDNVCKLDLASTIFTVRGASGCSRQKISSQNLRIDCEGGAGDYTAEFRVNWRGLKVLRELVINVWALETVDEFAFTTDWSAPDGLSERDWSEENHCWVMQDRLGKTDNLQEIVQVGHDPMFPPTAASIGQSGEDCGDSATGISVQCSSIDTWGTFESAACHDAIQYYHKFQ